MWARDWSIYSFWRCQSTCNVLWGQKGVAIARRGTQRQKLEGSQDDHKTEGFDVINLSMAIDNHTLNEFMRSVYTRAVAIAAIIVYIASPHYVHHHNRINIGKERNELCILWLINLPATKKWFDQRLRHLLTSYVFFYTFCTIHNIVKRKQDKARGNNFTPL